MAELTYGILDNCVVVEKWFSAPSSHHEKIQFCLPHDQVARAGAP